jgi:hypothetical protein
MDASNSIDASGPWFAGTYVNGLLNLTEVVLGRLGERLSSLRHGNLLGWLHGDHSALLPYFNARRPQKRGGSRRTAFLRVATAALTGRHFCGNAFDGILFLGLDLLDEVATSMGVPAVA